MPMLTKAYELLPEKAKKEDGAKLALQYIYERLPAFYMLPDDEGQQISADIVKAVLATPRSMLTDINECVEKLHTFVTSKETNVENLVSANKRIANILRKQGLEDLSEVAFDKKIRKDFSKEKGTPEPPADEQPKAMVALREHYEKVEKKVMDAAKSQEYKIALESLATFAEPLEAFFDEVLVMSKAEEERIDRLRLVRDVRQLFLSVADFSELSESVNK